PLLEEGRLYLASRNGEIFRVNPETGDLLERFKTHSLSGISAPVIHAHDHLYFHTVEGEIWCLTSDLNLVSKAELRIGTRCAPLATSSGIVSACLDGTVIVHSPALDETLFTYQTPGKILVDPILVDGDLVVADTTGGLVRLSPDQGREIWSGRAGSESISGMAASEETLVVCTGDGWVMGFDLDGGEQRWRTELDNFIHLAPIVVANQAVVLANHSVHYLDLADGGNRRSFFLDEEITSATLVEGNFLCLGTRGGHLHYRELNGSDDLWVYLSQAAITAPVILRGQEIIVVDEKGLLSSVIR
ncbi:MAG: PQQ-binding-like beta-propeller repeat protein, partial [Planctomycetes bacterium]|nr:PQQ-binding-like beta-propeller repeat protein [Planctomycetota bacterium]